MPVRVMTVCLGNICRSPMAQIVLQDALDQAGMGADVVVDSAGISGEETGNPIDRRARAVLTRHGYTVGPHRARRIRSDEVDESDLVLAATYQQWRALRAMARDNGEQVAMIRSFDPACARREPSTALDLEDPWYGDDADFEQTLAQIKAAVPAIVERLRRELGR